MFLVKFNLENEAIAKQFVEEANKNITSVRDERFDEQYDVAFGQKGSDVLVEYDTYQGVLDEYIETICKGLGLKWDGNTEYVDSYEFHKLSIAF